jgi:hypothetical protein
MIAGGDGEVSDETRRLAEEARRRAGDLPLSSIPGIAADALTAGGEGMTPEQIRALAVNTLDQAQQVSYLLGRLATLLDGHGDPQ